MVLRIMKDWIKIGNQSEFMQSSFRKYQWREALLLGLATLSKGLALKNSNMILKEMDELCNPKDRTGVPHMNPQKLPTLISNRNMIPMAMKPHAIFSSALNRTSRRHVLTGFSPPLQRPRN